MITPNDAVFVRYHHAGIPTAIDGDRHVIRIGSAVAKPFELSMAELRTQFKPVKLVAVKQCSGNSRGLFNPRVTGGQLAHGAMGNARWVGVSLKDLPLQDEDMPAIVDYLVKTYGNEQSSGPLSNIPET